MNRDSFEEQNDVMREISSRKDGNLAFYAGSDTKGTLGRRKRFFEKLRLHPDRAVFMQQTHSDHINVIINDIAGRARSKRCETTYHCGRGARSHEDAFPDTDALITQEKGTALCLQVADCAPVLLCDPVREVVGAAHAGWRGCVQNISGKTIQRMTQEFGSNPQDVVAAIGPAIGPCCFEVGENVIKEVRQKGLEGLSGSHWDLWEANKAQLVDAGVPERNIEILRECTSCTKDNAGEWKYFSYRREGGEAGRMVAVISLK